MLSVNSRKSRYAAVALAVVAALLAPPLDAQQPASAADLTEMSLEDLMDVEVTSVSRREQKVSEAASAVYVITQEDIRRSGMTSIPELLRMVPGVHVARLDSNKWGISIRGLNSRFSEKLLVMIDGRSIYNPLFAGVYWEAQDMMLEDIEQIEVIRGPGGTMWGSNAVSGVINIITKHSRDTQGTILMSGGGTQEGGFGGLRSGARFGSDLHFRVFSKYFNRRAQRKPGGGSSEDDWDVLRSGFRLDWDAGKRDSFMLSGESYDGDASTRVAVPTLAPPFQEQRIDDIDFRGSSLVGRWTRKVSDRSSTALQVYADWFDRSDVFLRHQRIKMVDLDFQHQFGLSAANQLLWGVGFRNTADDLARTQIGSANPLSRTTRLYNVFVQDEISLAENLLLTVGSKSEHNSYTGWEFQPSGSLLWDPTSRNTVWFSVARAVRIPARATRDLRLDIQAFRGPRNTTGLVSLFGSPDFQSEELLAYETGYRLRPSANIAFDLTAFYNIYENLQAIEPRNPFFDNSGPQRLLVIPIRITNDIEGETYGAEAAVRWRIKSVGQVDVTYSWLRERLRQASEPLLGGFFPIGLSGSPLHQFHARWHRQINSHLELGTAYYFFSALPGAQVPRHHRLDTRIGWRVSSRVRFSLGLQDLLDDRHLESVPILYDQPAEIRRNIYGKILWQF